MKKNILNKPSQTRKLHGPLLAWISLTESVFELQELSVVVWLFLRMTIVWQGLSNLQQIAASPIPCNANASVCNVWCWNLTPIEADHSYNLQSRCLTDLAGWDYTLSRGIYCFVINKELSDFEKQFKLIIDHHLFCAIYKKRRKYPFCCCNLQWH